MERIELKIYVAGSSTLVRAVANKWKFQDTMMGEQFITFTATSEKPIDWEIGDYCVFRGETFTLNYVPSVTQKAPSNTVQDAYTYENVKFDSMQDELVRCMMLDITPTTGQYIAALGTNHTGSSRFQLFCGETTANGITFTAVCALAAKMQANLDRLYPGAWHIYVDTETTYTTASGETLLVTHTDSKLLTFDNSTVAQALSLVHTEFKLDFCIRGRNIYIGYSLENITAEETEEQFVFGYGKGYPSADNQGKGLFQIKQIANSQQKIVTRLRALGSTKNMPYRYYHKRYNELSQALFPTNLQLPGTFLPLGTPSDTADADGLTKWAQNNARSQSLRKVLGDANDAYLDKNDDAANCPEGVREDCARWDGSNSELPEIYPTIEGVTFGELRIAGVPDQTGATGSSAYQGISVHPDAERIDNILAVGYLDDGTLIDDANVGDGILPESDISNKSTAYPATIGRTVLVYKSNGTDDFDDSQMDGFKGADKTLFTVKDVASGSYFMAPTGPSYSSVTFCFNVKGEAGANADVGFAITVVQRSKSGSERVVATWRSPLVNSAFESVMPLPEIPDLAGEEQVSSLNITELSDVVVMFAPVIANVSSSTLTLEYYVGTPQGAANTEFAPEYNWGSVNGGSASYPFHVFIKDMGFDLTATFTDETPVMSMKSGSCVGREFEIGEDVRAATVNGIRGYLLTLNRVKDENLNTYYPSATDRITAGDYFVLLNINMPDAYIRAAEARLLVAATEYLSDNCDTKYTYQPFIDDIYLQRNIDAMNAAGTPEKSIFWRLYAGLKLSFNGIPSSENSPLPVVNMTIEQVTITMGDGITPKVEMTLNDDVQQSTIQKLTIAVDRIYNGSIFSNAGVGSNAEAMVGIIDRLFLSKTHDDTANGRISFQNIVTAVRRLYANDGINFGKYLPGMLGSGAFVGADGHGEFEEISVRGALRAAELVFNLVSAEEGESIRSIGHGEILTVVEDDDTYGTATLKLDGDQWATIEQGDICRGLYNTIEKGYDNAEESGFDSNGFRKRKGFFASYFKVVSINVSSKGECEFEYELQQGSEHPCPLMKFAVYGNTNNAKRERQSSIYTTAVGIAPRLLFLAGVNTWSIQPNNIKLAIGNVDGLVVIEELLSAQEYQDSTDPDKFTSNINGVVHYYQHKTLEGDAGFFCEDNIYLGGIINQFKAAALDSITSELGVLGQTWVLSSVDTFVVDCDKNGNALSNHSLELWGELMYGNETLTLDDAQGSCGFNDGNIFRSATFSNDNTRASRTFTFAQGDSVSSKTITIVLNSVSTNGTVYSARKSVSIITNRQGATGAKGDSGASVIFLGTWSASLSPVWNENVRNCVKHNGTYWLVNVAEDGTHDLGEPASDNPNWENIGAMRFVATELLLAERATISNLIANDVQTAEYGKPHVRMVGDTVEFYGTQSTPSIKLCTNEDGVGVLRFFDKDGKPLYDLGPDKILENFSEVENSWTERWMKKLAISGLGGGTQYLGELKRANCTRYFRFNEGYKSISTGNSPELRYNVSGGSNPSPYNLQWFSIQGQPTPTSGTSPSDYAGRSLIADGWYATEHNKVNGFDDNQYAVEADWTNETILYFTGGYATSSLVVWFKMSDWNAQQYLNVYDMPDGTRYNTIDELINAQTPTTIR